jgi:hypothetical protein
MELLSKSQLHNYQSLEPVSVEKTEIQEQAFVFDVRIRWQTEAYMVYS